MENDVFEITSDFKKNFILIPLVVFTISFNLFTLTACSKKVNVTPTKNNKDKSVNSISTKESNFSDFFMSSDGQDLLATTWTFIKAYFNSDASTMKKYLMKGMEVNSYHTGTFDNLTYLNLQWTFSEIKSKDDVVLCYIFETKNDSLTYLDLELKQINDKWKVSFYTLEK